jgi:cob(I)alamin adenosyltransferase
MDKSKIYTRLGDTGQTSLIGGKRVPKYHIRIEAYGTVDELNSFIGLIRDQPIKAHYQAILLQIQDRLFVSESLLALDEGNPGVKLPCLSEDDILLLEQEIDQMNENLPPLTAFILPGGHPIVSYTHIARCVCRRTERIILSLSQQHPVPENMLKYFNRLSDYLFVLSRILAQELGVGDQVWKAKACE